MPIHTDTSTVTLRNCASRTRWRSASATSAIGACGSRRYIRQRPSIGHFVISSLISHALCTPELQISASATRSPSARTSSARPLG